MAGNGGVVDWKGRRNGRKEERINVATVNKKEMLERRIW